MHVKIVSSKAGDPTHTLTRSTAQVGSLFPVSSYCHTQEKSESTWEQLVDIHVPPRA